MIHSIKKKIIIQPYKSKILFGNSKIFPEYDVCPICLESIQTNLPTIKTKCLHTFHSKCLRKLICRSINCPCCRADLICNKTISRLIYTSNIISINFTDETDTNKTCFDRMSKSIDEIKNNICEYVSNKINKIAEQNIIFVFILLPVGYSLIAIYFGSNILVYVVIKPILSICNFIYKGYKYLHNINMCLLS
jgi:hypothetical protein